MLLPARFPQNCQAAFDRCAYCGVNCPYSRVPEIVVRMFDTFENIFRIKNNFAKQGFSQDALIKLLQY